MKELFSSWGKLAAVVILVMTGTCGCGLFQDPAVRGIIPHVEGRWTGTVRAITLYDTAFADNTYAGTALQLEEGPALDDPVPAGLGGGGLPILTRPSRASLRAILADELKPGQRVEISGFMQLNYAMNPKPYVGTKKSEAVLRRRPHQPDEMRTEHLIGIRKLVVIEPDGKRTSYSLTPRISPEE